MAATALLSVIFLKRRYHRHHISGLFLIIGGVTLVGYGGISNSGSGAKTTILGILITLSAQLVYGGVYVVDEAIFRRYKAHPLKLLAWEGIFGVPIYATILVFI